MLEDGSTQQKPILTTDYVTAHEIDLDEYNNILESEAISDARDSNELMDENSEVSFVEDKNDNDEQELQIMMRMMIRIYLSVVIVVNISYSIST